MASIWPRREQKSHLEPLGALLCELDVEGVDWVVENGLERDLEGVDEATKADEVPERLERV